MKTNKAHGIKTVIIYLYGRSVAAGYFNNVVFVCIDCVTSNCEVFKLTLAMVTIFVFLIAREIARKKEVAIPDTNAGTTAFHVASNCVAGA